MRLIIGITGASGSVYAQRLIDKLCINMKLVSEIALIVSKSGEQVWGHELGVPLPEGGMIKCYENDSFFAPPASGSAAYDAMVVIPCTMGTLGRVAHTTSNDLLSRSADVMLKERRKLLLVVRETPYNLLHIESMRLVTLAGGIILPASPSFYSHPTRIDELVDTVVDRVLSLLGIPNDGFKWGSSPLD